MKTIVRFTSLLAAALLLSRCVHAQNTADKNASKPAPAKPGPVMVIYRPAPGAVPAARGTGGSRGSGDAAVRLDVLAPDETGLTTEEQPSLFWYQSKPAQASFELTLLEEGKPKPLLRVKFDKAVKAGIQRVNLADHGVKLEKAVEYRWVVALVTDPENRSSDLVASSSIQRVDPSPELREQLAKASPQDRATIYAAAGIWHDALASVSDLIEAHPEAENLHSERAELLRQIGLSAAASADAPKPRS